MKISIVTPSFRQLEWLELCIASVADQEGVEVEHIVQDAGTPGFGEFSREMEKRWPDRHGYSRRMISEPDEGMYDAVNRGLGKATGEVLAYLNCDEQYLPGILVQIVDWFTQSPADEVLFGDAIVVNAEGHYLCSRRALIPQIPHALACGNLPVFTCATFFRATVRDRGFLFEKQWRVVGDAAWAVRLRRARVPCRAPGVALAVFTETGQNLSRPETARSEQLALRRTAPAWARAFSPLLLLFYWCRRWWAGAYRRHEVRYSVYTKQCPKARVAFGPYRSIARWPGRRLSFSP